MSNIEWGPQIAVEGKRPTWLKDADLFQWVSRNRTWGDWDDDQSTSGGAYNPEAWHTLTYIRLPADHAHYKQTQPIDWSAPIEAVHEDGSVKEAHLHRYDGDGRYRVTGKGLFWTFDAKGRDFHGGDGLRIRNVATKPVRTAAEMLDRLEALARKLAVAPFCNAHAEQAEARAIVAEMTPPVDPDLIEARKVKDAWVNDKSGADDVDEMLALCIKRGRELERGA